jgi:hypothetical protein
VNPAIKGRHKSALHQKLHHTLLGELSGNRKAILGTSPTNDGYPSGSIFSKGTVWWIPALCHNTGEAVGLLHTVQASRDHA